MRANDVTPRSLLGQVILAMRQNFCRPTGSKERAAILLRMTLARMNPFDPPAQVWEVQKDPHGLIFIDYDRLTFIYLRYTNGGSIVHVGSGGWDPRRWMAEQASANV